MDIEGKKSKSTTNTKRIQHNNEGGMNIERGANTLRHKMSSLRKRIDRKKKKNRAIIQSLKGQKTMEVEFRKQKDWKTSALDKLHALSGKSNLGVCRGLKDLFKEDNKEIITRIVDGIGTEKALWLAKDAIETFYGGELKRNKPDNAKTLGASFISLVKNYLDVNDPMQLKSIFSKVETSTQKKKIKKSQGQIDVNTKQTKGKIKPMNNIFGSLAQ